MGTKLSEFLQEIEAEARAEGPAAVAALAAFDERYRIAHELVARRRKTGERTSRRTNARQARHENI